MRRGKPPPEPTRDVPHFPTIPSIIRQFLTSRNLTERTCPLRLLLTTLALAAATQAQLVTFTAGAPAKASEVNGNFAYLAARLDSLTKALAAKDAGTPKGAIAGFLTKPSTDGYLPNSDQTWMLAAG